MSTGDVVSELRAVDAACRRAFDDIAREHGIDTDEPTVIARAITEIETLSTHVRDLADELEARITVKYGPASTLPLCELRLWERDMKPIHAARKLLGEETNE